MQPLISPRAEVVVEWSPEGERDNTLFSRSKCKDLSQFQKHDVNDILNALGRVFNDRYRVVSQPSLNLDNSKAAMNMEPPLCITPTRLKSPNNNSNPHQIIPDNGHP